MKLQTFQEHCGDCPQCRKVVEAFYNEMPQPHLLCCVGWKILEGLKEEWTTAMMEKNNEPNEAKRGGVRGV